MTYWHNVNEAICGNFPHGGNWYRDHRIKLWRYRSRAAYGKPKAEAILSTTEGRKDD